MADGVQRVFQKPLRPPRMEVQQSLGMPLGGVSQQGPREFHKAGDITRDRLQVAGPISDEFDPLPQPAPREFHKVSGKPPQAREFQKVPRQQEPVPSAPPQKRERDRAPREKRRELSETVVVDDPPRHSKKRRERPEVIALDDTLRTLDRRFSAIDHSDDLSDSAPAGTQAAAGGRKRAAKEAAAEVVPARKRARQDVATNGSGGRAPAAPSITAPAPAAPAAAPPAPPVITAEWRKWALLDDEGRARAAALDKLHPTNNNIPRPACVPDWAWKVCDAANRRCMADAYVKQLGIPKAQGPSPAATAPAPAPAPARQMTPDQMLQEYVRKSKSWKDHVQRFEEQMGRKMTAADLKERAASKTAYDSLMALRDSLRRAGPGWLAKAIALAKETPQQRSAARAAAAAAAAAAGPVVRRKVLTGDQDFEDSEDWDEGGEWPDDDGTYHVQAAEVPNSGKGAAEPADRPWDEEVRHKTLMKQYSADTTVKIDGPFKFNASATSTPAPTFQPFKVDMSLLQSKPPDLAKIFGAAMAKNEASGAPP
eukprot:TRINITY_DN14422_c0_g1_i1.p1 TRINITY_DN14422_c0_g1~~TRINITY_DN14422_c0_g1_i1.p1  ORF type:complete len:539 (+),score=114.86 TRINITY_DN14422_c0_g1_i1:98-1714(+)